MEQASLPEARRSRDAGIAKVITKNKTWLDLALEVLPLMKADGHTTVTGEGIRVWMNGRIADPTSPHAWGALVRTAMKRGLLKDTGRQAQMFTEKSHARRTPLWEIV